MIQTRTSYETKNSRAAAAHDTTATVKQHLPFKLLSMTVTVLICVRAVLSRKSDLDLVFAPNADINYTPLKLIHLTIRVPHFQLATSPGFL